MSLTCLRLPSRVRVPQVEYHWFRRQSQLASTTRYVGSKPDNVAIKTYIKLKTPRNSILKKMVNFLTQVTSYYMKVKSNLFPRTDHEGPEGQQRYSSNLSLTSALEEGGWLKPRPGRFTPRKETRYALYSTLGLSQSRFGQVRKISPPPEFDPRTSQPQQVAIPTTLSWPIFYYTYE